MYEKSVKELQLIEQNIQQYQMQRQQFQSQLIETESALSEIDKTKETYKIIGNIMVKIEKAALKKELEKKKEMFELRIKSLTTQEDKLKSKAKELQQDVLEGMKDDRADKKSD